jgi:hypothetical protein
MSQRKVAVLTALVANLMAAGISSAAEPRGIAGIFSSLAFNLDAGDLVGMELLLIPAGGNDDYRAVVQVVEGDFPLVAIATVHVKEGAFDLVFKAEGIDTPISMKCKVTSEGVTCANKMSTEKMKRGKSYWQ